jgi:hypothetical protein
MSGSTMEVPALGCTKSSRLAVFVETGPVPVLDYPRVESRPVEGQETCPLPEDPALAEVAAGLNRAGHWGWMVDSQWRIVFMTDDLRVTFGGQLGHAPVALGEHFFGPENVRTNLEYRAGANQVGLFRELLMRLGPWVLAAPSSRWVGRLRLLRLRS